MLSTNLELSSHLRQYVEFEQISQKAIVKLHKLHYKFEVFKLFTYVTF